MRYVIASYSSDSAGILFSDRKNFDDVDVARTIIVEALAIEQKFDFVVSNLLELEMFLAQTTTERMLYGTPGRQAYDESRDASSRKIMNLLSTAKSYIDALPHHINSIFERNEERTELARNFLREEYGKSLGYRAMEALRNFVQHQGLPVHGASYSGTTIGSGANTQQRFTIDIWLRPCELRGGKFKAQVLRELENCGDNVDLKFLIREYVEGISNANCRVRELVSDKVKNAHDVIACLIKSYADNISGGVLRGDLAIVVVRNGVLRESKALLVDPFVYRERLIRKNLILTNLRSRFISTEVNPSSHSRQ